VDRGPLVATNMRPMVKQIVVDPYGALYAVHNTEEVKVFELTVCPAAQMLGDIHDFDD